MTEQVQEVAVEVEEETVVTVNLFYDVAHKTLLAGLGAASLAQEGLMKGFETSSGFAAKLVERGEEVSKQRREQAATEAEKRQEQAKDMGENLTGKVTETYNQATNAALNRMNVPSSEDIQSLSKQISALGRKVDRVRKEQKELTAA